MTYYVEASDLNPAYQYISGMALSKWPLDYITVLDFLNMYDGCAFE